jgi:hypothetical protein
MSTKLVWRESNGHTACRIAYFGKRLSKFRDFSSGKIIIWCNYWICQSCWHYLQYHQALWHAQLPGLIKTPWWGQCFPSVNVGSHLTGWYQSSKL